MCGISGIVDLMGKEVGFDAIQKMTDSIAHRGPDDFGYFQEGSIALGHRRLSILDLSASGHQPMKYSDELVIVYNGEIYNYLEIKDELLALGYQFNGGSDTEVILASYKHWGEECVNHFNGMWGFAIYDKVKKHLFCSRDRFGVKPFYFAVINNQFIFASEIKQFLPFLQKRVVNTKVLMDYLVFGLEEHSNETFFKGISKLLPSHNMLLDLQTGEFKTNKYYDINIDEKLSRLSEEESVSLWRKEFERSVSYRLRSDVKVGTCLSGGLDSSSIASVASRLNQSKELFAAITAKSEDNTNDESSYAKKVVDFCDLEWHQVHPKSKDFESVVDEVIRVQEEPFGSPSIVMQYYVLKKSKEIGCPVLLDGQGGDETLLGYERYYPAYLLSMPFWKRTKAFLQSSQNSKLSKKDLLLYWLYFTNADVRIKRQKKKFKFIKAEYLALTSTDLIREMSQSYKDIKTLQLLEITKTQLPHLLRYEDKNSMRHSIETRLPFLDYRLVETSLSINNSFKIKDGWTKYLLRKSIEDKLPEEIVWRKNKFGFEAPTNLWMKDKEWFLKEISSSRIIQRITNGNIPNSLDNIVLWKMFNIARWEKIYNIENE